MTNLRDLLNAARREQSTVHQIHLPDDSRVTTTHSTGPATHELIALAPQLAEALIDAREALTRITWVLDDERGAMEAAALSYARATLVRIDAIMEGREDD